MSEWKKYKLGDVAEIVGGGTPKTKVPKYWNGDISWLSVVDFNTENKYVYKTEKTITQKGLDNSSTKILNKNNIIISARGTVGAIAVLKKPMAFNQSCYGIKSIKDVSDPDFLYYLTKDSINSFQQIAHGGVFDTITRETFNAINILLPLLPEIGRKVFFLMNLISPWGSHHQEIRIMRRELELHYFKVMRILDLDFQQIEFTQQIRKDLRKNMILW